MKGPIRVAHGRKWFWVLLPKQKDLACRGETRLYDSLLWLGPQVVGIDNNMFPWGRKEKGVGGSKEKGVGSEWH